MEIIRQQEWPDYDRVASVIGTGITAHQCHNRYSAQTRSSRAVFTPEMVCILSVYIMNLIIFYVLFQNDTLENMVANQQVWSDISTTLSQSVVLCKYHWCRLHIGHFRYTKFHLTSCASRNNGTDNSIEIVPRTSRQVTALNAC